MTIIKDRAELPGVQLDVGQPILESREVEASLDVSLGRWVYLKSSKLETVNNSNMSAFIALVRAYRTDGRGNVVRSAERDLMESLDLKARTIEKTVDGLVVRARGDVSFRLPRGAFGDSDGEFESSGYLGRASELEIRRLEESPEPGFRADRIESDSEFGGTRLEGNAQIEFDQVSIRSDRVSLFSETTIWIGIDEGGKIEVKGEPVSLEALEGALKDTGADKTTPVVIEADQRADWDVVSEVFRTVKGVGVARMSVNAIGVD